MQFGIRVEKKKKLVMDDMQVENDNGLVADDEKVVVDYYI